MEINAVAGATQELYFPFDGDYKDYSGKSRNLTKYGSSTLSSDEKGDSDCAYMGFGSNYGYFYVANPLSGKAVRNVDFSITGKIYLTGSAVTGRMSVFGLGSIGNEPIFSIALNSDGTSFEMFGGSAVNVFGISAGWHNVAVTHVSGTDVISLYIDETLIGNYHIMGKTGTADYFTIGNSNNGGTGYSIKIDDVRLFSTALTAEQVFELKYKTYLLFEKYGTYYSYSDKNLTAIGNSLSPSYFTTYGCRNFEIGSISEDPGIFKGFKPFVFYNSEQNLNIDITFKPKKVLVKGSGDILLNAKQIKKLKSFTETITSTGSGKARTVFSTDSGVTWKKYNSVSGLLEVVTLTVDNVLLNGNTSQEINSIPENIWSEVLLSQKIRFAYALNKDVYSDIIKVDQLSMKADIFGYLSEYKNAEVKLRNGYSEVTVPDMGTYVVTYL